MPRALGRIFFSLLCSSLVLTLANSQTIGTEPRRRQISQINLLLPILGAIQPDREVSYVLEATEGCYEWRSSRPDLLTIEELPDEGQEGCSSKAKVRVQAQDEAKNTILVTAEDKDDHEVLKCEARIARIERLDILTRVRTIDVGDSETLELIGYDSKGNAFTTLEGLRFGWNIEQPEKYANFETFRAASMKTTAMRQAIEDSKYQADLVVLKGLKIGEVTVKASVQETGYKNITANVNVLIVEHFMVYPERDIYILPLSKIQFELYAVKISRNGASHTKIALPNSNYFWASRKSEIVKIDNSGVLTSGKTIGDTFVYIEDNRGTENRVENKVEVVEPWKIEITARECPSLNCYSKRLPALLKDQLDQRAFDTSMQFIFGKHYHIKATILDQRENEIMLADNVKIAWTLPDNLEIISQSRNEFIVKASSVSTKPAVATLQDILLEGGTYSPSDITVEKTIHVTLPLKIFSIEKTIHLPSPQGSVLQDFELESFGGSGHFEWQSSNPKIASVDSHGRIRAKAVGEAYIDSSDKYNPANRARIHLIVTSVKQTDFVEINKELIVGKASLSYLYSTGGANRIYSRCDKLSYNYSSTESQVVDIKEASDVNQEQIVAFITQKEKDSKFYSQRFAEIAAIEYTIPSSEEFKEYIKYGVTTEARLNTLIRKYKTYGICGAFNLYPHKVGRSSMKATVGANFGGSEKIQNQIVYSEFSTVGPLVDQEFFEKNRFALAYGSSLTWKITGGPINWNNIKGSIDSLSQHQDIAISGVSDFRENRQITIKCIFSGELRNEEVVLSSSNPQSSRLLEPIKMKTSLRIDCGNVDRIKLFKIKGRRYLSTSKFNSSLWHPSQLNVLNSKRHAFQMWAYTKGGHPFYNFSSIDVDWRLEPPSTQNHLFSKDTKLILDDAQTGDEYNMLEFTDYIGKIKLVVESSSFEENKKKFATISDEMDLNIIDSIYIEPPFYSILNSKDNEASFHIQGGSGNFRASINDTTLAAVEYDALDRKIIIRPIAKGWVILKVEDLSQESILTAEAVVKIVDPYSIRINIDPELVKSEADATAQVTLLDQEGVAIPKEQLHNVAIQLHKNDAIELKDFNADYLGNGGFKLNAVLRKPGFETITIAATAKGRSSEKEFSLKGDASYNIFSQIKALPAYVVSSEGCSVTVKLLFSIPPSSQLKVKIDVKIADPTIAQIISQDYNSITLKSLKQGTTRIIATATTTDKIDTNNRVEIPIEVGIVDGVQILSSYSRTAYVGATVRMLASPMIKGRSMTAGFCPFSYSWATSTTQFAKLDSLDAPSKSGSGFSSHVGMNVTGTGEGSAEIIVKLETGSGYLGKTSFEGKTKVSFINPLDSLFPKYLNSPESQSDHMILPPDSTYQILTSRKHGNLTFTSPCDRSELFDVSISGVVSTNAKRGIGMVIINDNDIQHTQRAVVIEITDIRALVVRGAQQAALLSTGGTIELTVALQDEHGRVFPSLLRNQKVVALSSNFSVVSADLDITNSNLILQGNAEGEAIISVYLEEDPRIFDMFKVTVGSLIFPSGASIHRGNSIKFRLSSAELEERNITWSSSNSNIVSVVNHTGEASAMAKGQARVFLQGDAFAEVLVNVFEVDTLVLESEGSSKLTNTLEIKDGSHKVHVKTFSEGRLVRGIMSSDDKITSNIVLKCVVDHKEWFEVDSICYEGEAYCTLRPKIIYPADKPFPSLIAVSAELSSKDRKFTISSSSELEYEWGFQMHSPELTSVFLKLT